MSKATEVRSVEELNGKRPERFACPECAQPTSIDLDNFVRPHGATHVCNAVGQRVAVRWREESLRCASCRAFTSVDGRVRAVAHDKTLGRACPGSGQPAIQWRTLKFGDGSVNINEPDRSGWSEPPKKSSAGRVKRTEVGVRKQSAAKREQQRLAEKAKVIAASPEEIAKHAALRASERAQERLRIAEKKKAESRGPVFVRMVSGGLPGSARRH